MFQLILSISVQDSGNMNPSPQSFATVAGTAFIFLRRMSPLSTFDAIRPFLNPLLGAVDYFAIREKMSAPIPGQMPGDHLGRQRNFHQGSNQIQPSHRKFQDPRRYFGI
jgi:hypothetical protein